jgi:hypothetical protein
MFNGQEVDQEIYKARLHTAHIHNGAYYNARVAELAREFKPQCANQQERDLLKMKLRNAVDCKGEKMQQGTAALGHIVRVLSGN